ncbi:MAG: Microtubule-nucleating Tub4p (gamma-tubulin) complex component [Bathelium mastoideum]|nr:MAG: Microtubule-nucleating Tub4p (gamma-tubulin) complex component [Bathelium mastoideum]
MSNSQEERIDKALIQLVQRQFISRPDEDEASADERFDSLVESARDTIDRQEDPVITADVNHASDLIKKKLIRENNSPDKALRFSNLYSRLLSQPVLSQKWAILYLLYQLSDGGGPKRRETPEAKSSSPLSRLHKARQPPIDSRHTPETEAARQYTVDSPAFNDAFSTDGLRRIQTDPQAQPMRPLPRERPERQDGKKSHDANGEDSGIGENAQALPTPRFDPAPSEPALLRDLPFTLQGLSSTNLQFTAPDTLKLPTTLPVPIITLLHALAEPSLLYKGLAGFVESSEGGLVGQSLRAAIGSELRSYLGLVASLESQIRRALAALDEKQPKNGLGKAGVTLRRCVIWTREAAMGLRLMSLIVEKSKNKKGGELISTIHAFSSSHGDAFVSTFAERLLSHVTRPFYDMLRQWTYDGELSDPYLEFFVSEQKEPIEGEDGHKEKGGAMSVWEDKYKLNQIMIPTILSEDFAKKVFLIGKSLNFLRYGCGDSVWVESYSKDASRELRYGDTAALESSIDEAYKSTMARLTHLMAENFMLFEHLKALKKYILLGQGDFIQLLMESLSNNLDRPANSQYRHTLTAQLEHAIRSSNAQYDSAEVLRRLDARMLELSHGETGWDVFTLEYKIDAPVDVIVTPWASKQYLKVFNFLWRVKRVEFALGSTWRRCMTGARGVLGAVDDKLGKDWKKARCCIAEMIHFVCQLQYYILFEVIESSWDQLQTAIQKPDCTLDDLISAHSEYLTAITRKGLLGSTTTDFTSQLHELLKVMLAYKDVVDGLYSFSVSEFTRRQEFNARIETRTAQGQWGITERDEEDFNSPQDNKRNPLRDTDSPFPITSTSEDDMLPALRLRLASLSLDFRSKVNVLLGDLAYQPDVDMRFLGVVMNFNDVYKPVRRKRRAADRDGKLKAGEKGKSLETPQVGERGERSKADGVPGAR